MRCPRCPAVWLARGADADGRVASAPSPPPMTRRGTLIIEGEIAARPSGRAPGRPLTEPVSRGSVLRRYGVAAGAAALMLAVAAVVLLAPDVSALPGIALLERDR